MSIDIFLKDPFTDPEEKIILAGSILNDLGIAEGDYIEVVYGARSMAAQVICQKANDDEALFAQPSDKLATGLMMVTNLDYRIQMSGPKSITIGPVLGLLIAVKRADINLNYALQYARAYDEVKGLVYCMSYDNIDFTNKVVTGHYVTSTPAGLVWNKGTFPLPSAVYRRVFLPNGVAKLSSVVPQGVVTQKYAYEKWQNYLQMMKSHVLRPHLPVTKYVNDATTVLSMLGQYGSVYVKPTSNDCGIGVIRIDNIPPGAKVSYTLKDKGPQKLPFANMDLLADYLKKNILKSPHVVQASIPLVGINDTQRFDLRVMVQKTGSGSWACTGYMARVSAPDSAVNNAYMGGKMCDFDKVLEQAFDLNPDGKRELYKDIEAVAVEVAKTIELGYGIQAEIGLDIGFDGNKGIWIIESNPLPPYHVNWHDKAVSQEMTKNPLRYIAYRSGFPPV